MANQKDYVDHKFTIMEADPEIYPDGHTVLITLFTVHETSKWKAFRHLVSLGVRLQGYLKDTLMEVSISELASKSGVVMIATSLASRKTIEEALHSLYLFMEYPEKYA